MSEPKLNIKEETSTKKTRSPPKKAKVEQSVPRKKKLKTDAEKTAERPLLRLFVFCLWYMPRQFVFAHSFAFRSSSPNYVHSAFSAACSFICLIVFRTAEPSRVFPAMICFSSKGGLQHIDIFLITFKIHSYGV